MRNIKPNDLASINPRAKGLKQTSVAEPPRNSRAEGLLSRSAIEPPRNPRAELLKETISTESEKKPYFRTRENQAQYKALKDAESREQKIKDLSRRARFYDTEIKFDIRDPEINYDQAQQTSLHFYLCGTECDPTIYKYEIDLFKDIKNEDLPAYIKLKNNTFTISESFIFLRENIDNPYLTVIRKPNLSTDAYYLTHEKSYVTQNEEVYNVVKKEYDEKYINIKSFEYRSKYGTNEEIDRKIVHPPDGTPPGYFENVKKETEMIQDVINKMYPEIQYLNDDYTLSPNIVAAMGGLNWTESITFESASRIIDSTASFAKIINEILELDENNTIELTKLPENVFPLIYNMSNKEKYLLYLRQVASRTTETIGKVPFKHTRTRGKELLPQENMLLNLLGSKQMLLGKMEKVHEYFNVLETSVDPWILMFFNLGCYLSWNKLLNLSTISCIIENNDPTDSLFCFRLFFTLNQWAIHSNNFNISTSYFRGFFVVKYNKDDETTDIETKREYNKKYVNFMKNMKINPSLYILDKTFIKTKLNPYKPYIGENNPYTIYCIFSNKPEPTTDPYDLLFVTYNCNLCEIGHLCKRRRWFYIELLQIQSACFQNKLQFTILLSKSNQPILDNISELLNQFCQTEIETEADQTTAGKLPAVECYQSWFHKKTAAVLINNAIDLSTNKDIEIFVRKAFSISQIKDILEQKLVDKHITNITITLKQFRQTEDINLDYTTFEDTIIRPNIEYLQIDLCIDGIIYSYYLMDCFMHWTDDSDKIHIEDPAIKKNDGDRLVISIGTHEILKQMYGEKKYKTEGEKHFRYSDDLLTINKSTSYMKFSSDENIQKIDNFVGVHMDKLVIELLKKNITDIDMINIDDTYLETLANLQKLKTNFINLYKIKDKILETYDLNPLVYPSIDLLLSEAIQQETILQHGGGSYNSKFNKLIIKIKNLDSKLIKIIKSNDISLNFRKYTNGYIMHINFKKFIKYSTQTENDSYALNFYKNIYTYKTFIDICRNILPKNILIIASNIMYAIIILETFKPLLTKMTLFIIKNKNVLETIYLKERYSNLIDIYYISGNISNETCNIINKLCKNTKFDTIIIDIGWLTASINNIESIKILIISYLIICDMLEVSGICIIYNFLYELYEKQNILLNLIYDLFLGFNTRYINDYIINTAIQCGYIFTGFEPPNDKLYKLLTILLNNLSNSNNITEFYNYFDNFINNYKLSNIFTECIINLYNNHYLHNKQLFKKLIKKYNIKIDKKLIKNNSSILIDKNDINNNSSILIEKYDINNNLLFISYKIEINFDIKKIPLYLSDIIIPDNYSIQKFTFPIYSNINKSFLLSDIQFLTYISKKIELLDYVVIYLGCYNLPHIQILFKLFNVNKWILFDEVKIAFNIKKKSNIIIIKQRLNINTINELKNKYKNIIFICNNNHTIHESPVHLVNSLKIAIQLEAKFILLNCKFPLNQKNDEKYTDNDYYIGNINDLKLNEYRKLFSNPDLSTEKETEILYIKGEILLPLYQDKDDTNFRLIITQNSKNKYEFDIYNLEIIYKHLNYYILNNFMFINYDKKNILEPLKISVNIDYFKILVGYDGCIQNLMEFIILNRYLCYIKNTDNQITTFKLIYSINNKLEKYTNKTILDFNYNNKIFEYGYVWKNILKINRFISAKKQYEIIKLHEDEYTQIFGSKQIKHSLSILNKFINNNNDYYYLLSL